MASSVSYLIRDVAKKLGLDHKVVTTTNHQQAFDLLHSVGPEQLSYILFVRLSEERSNIVREFAMVTSEKLKVKY